MSNSYACMQFAGHDHILLHQAGILLDQSQIFRPKLGIFVLQCFNRPLLLGILAT